MESIFNNHIKEALEYAHRLEVLGEKKSSEALCLKLVKKEASYHGVDLLEMFYGKNIYSSIHGVSDAAKCIFIIKCAADAYDVISARKSVNSSILPWSNDGDCNNYVGDNNSINYITTTAFSTLEGILHHSLHEKLFILLSDILICEK